MAEFNDMAQEIIREVVKKLEKENRELKANQIPRSEDGSWHSMVVAWPNGSTTKVSESYVRHLIEGVKRCSAKPTHSKSCLFNFDKNKARVAGEKG